MLMLWWSSCWVSEICVQTPAVAAVLRLIFIAVLGK